MTTPVPGEQDRKEAARLRGRADWHERQARLLREEAVRLEGRATQDETAPPSREERIRRVLEPPL